jgi:Mn2+/Fe2+ NRAMP family transporter
MFLPELYIAIFVVKVLIAAAAGFIVALSTNLVLKTPAYHYLASTTFVTALTFSAIYILSVFNLAPLLWFEHDGSWRASLWENRPEIIAAIVTVLVVCAWQFGFRKIRRCRIPI